MGHIFSNAIKEIIVESSLITIDEISLVLGLDVSVVTPVFEIESVNLT